MSHSLRFLMAQMNPMVGAIHDNTSKIVQIIETHQSHHDVIIFPELALTGYSPEDWLLRNDFYSAIETALTHIQSATQRCHVILGHPYREGDKQYNAASIITQGKTHALYYKQHLPNYSVFDEQRYFIPGTAPAPVFTLHHYRIGLCICEDMWHPGPVEQLLQARANVMICINASPFEEHKYQKREALLRKHAEQGLHVLYVNQTGGQDELVFDGQSMVFNANGTLAARAPAFRETVQTIHLTPDGIQGDITPLLSKEALIYNALQYGLQEYVSKNGFKSVLLGLSGGIDSALTLAIAHDALGEAHVHPILLPSRYTAKMSVEDALEQTKRMGIQPLTLPIEPIFQSYLTTLQSILNKENPTHTEENLQARIRGTLLMALSNHSGHLLLTTSNKSETAVGYSTLYGDMAGGFAVLKDVLKTTVYALAHYRNSLSPVIPDRVLTRAPSAELAPNQTDQDHLPPYAILDAIITHYMEERLTPLQIIKQGYESKHVYQIIQWIKQNEYKRYQAAPGIKITSAAFGRDWRFPITSGF